MQTEVDAARLIEEIRDLPSGALRTIKDRKLPMRSKWSLRATKGVLFRNVDFAGPLIGGFLRHPTFVGCSFEKVEFGAISGRGTSFEDCTFDGSTIGGRWQADFRDCRFVRCTFTNCTWKGVGVDNTFFVQCTFARGSIVRSSFMKCRFEDVTFDCEFVESGFHKSLIARVTVVVAKVKTLAIRGCQVVDSTLPS